MRSLPTEIILDEILPKVAVKSLLRFKSVSKQFQTLISSPSFIDCHLRHSLTSDANRLFITNHCYAAGKCGPHLNDLDSPKTPPSPLPIPDTFQPDHTNCIIGSCNGLLLMRGSSRLMVINPLTRFYSLIPEMDWLVSPNSLYGCGFGYDAAKDDYKIACFTEDCIMVASLREKSWRMRSSLANANSHHDSLVNSTVVRRVAAMIDNHLCHWLIWCPSQKKHRILCYDICTQDWTPDIPLPDDNDDNSSSSSSHFADLLFNCLRDKRKDVRRLRVLDGLLTVLIRNHTEEGGYGMWVMKVYGMKRSWVKLFALWDLNDTPLCFGTGSNSSRVLISRQRRRESRLLWYDATTNLYTPADIHIRSSSNSIHDVHRHLYEACVVKGSLVTLPGGKPIPPTHL